MILFDATLLDRNAPLIKAFALSVEVCLCGPGNAMEPAGPREFQEQSWSPGALEWTLKPEGVLGPLGPCTHGGATRVWQDSWILPEPL